MRLTQILQYTTKENYAVGSFSPRYVNMIKPVLKAAEECRSPALVQISQKELNLYGITAKAFADEYFRLLKELSITVPTGLHLDHTKDFSVIQEAIEAGFESVMIDASDLVFEENAAITRKVVDYAHERGVEVEAELGKIGANDKVETDGDFELYTVPEEAEQFVRITEVDALAVSVGTAHGVYTVKQPTIEYSLIEKIRRLVPSYLVLHGGSGVPADMVIGSYQLKGGGISKVNIATDLELAFLAAIHQDRRMDNQWCNTLSEELLETGRQAVKETVKDKIINYLHSDGKAW